MKNLRSAVIIDTSAFLSLEAINLLNLVLQYFEVFSTASVIKELEDFTQYGDELGRTAQQILKNKDYLLVRTIETKEKINHLQPTDIDLYHLALSEKIPLITDDHRFNHHVKDKITVYFSTYFLMLFALHNLITKQEALKKLEYMRKLRNWNNNIMYLKTKDGLNMLKG